MIKLLAMIKLVPFQNHFTGHVALTDGFPQNPSAKKRVQLKELVSLGFRDCVLVKMGSFLEDIMYSCQLSLISKDSPEVQYNLVN